jgi:hypothetical protein
MAQARDYEVPTGQPPASVTPVPVAAPSPASTVVAGASSMATNGYLLVKLSWEFGVMKEPWRMLSTDEFVILTAGLLTLAHFLGNWYLFWRNRGLADYELRRDRKFLLALIKAQQSYPVSWVPGDTYAAMLGGLQIGSGGQTIRSLLHRMRAPFTRATRTPGRRDGDPVPSQAERVEITTGPLPRDDVSAEGSVIPPH